jgi:riboflavin biosynthesis pyrimidine reductase
MASLILKMSVSLDGYVAPVDGSTDWIAAGGSDDGLSWGETTISAGDLAQAITRLKRERSDGYLLAHGGTRFARSLVETGLIDKYRLVVHPVVLGAGERIFLAPLTLAPVSTTVFSGGAVAHVFAAHP